MKQTSLNENPTPWLKSDTESLKVASLNCAGLKPHFADFYVDEHLLKADIIHQIETSLNAADENDFSLPGYNSHFLSIGNGKEMGTFYKNGLAHHEQYANYEILIFRPTDQAIAIL